MYHYLHSDKLTVEITGPGTGSNDGFRFDRTGYISEVILNDGTRFCASEPRNLSHQSSKGRGFCTCNSFKSGREIDVGEYCPIVGVGLVVKQSKAERKYDYNIGFRPFPIREQYTDTEVIQEVMPILCNGYAFYEKRTITAYDDTLVNNMYLSNEGSKDFTILEYCHNFISVDGMSVGPDYVIEMPQTKDITGIEQQDAERGGKTNFVGFGSGFRMKQFEPFDYSVQLQDTSFYKSGEPFVWRVSNSAAKAFVEGTDNVDFQRAKVWSCDHMVCPEVYQTITLKPGEHKSWSRTLRFGRTEE